jgi:hypothetical protein
MQSTKPVGMELLDTKFLGYLYYSTSEETPKTQIATLAPTEPTVLCQEYTVL